jgi:hypothetical protein
MKCAKIFTVLAGLTVLLEKHAFATTSSQILVMSNQLYQIAKDLTTGILPTSISFDCHWPLGICSMLLARSIGEGVHELTNIIAVGGMWSFLPRLYLVNAAMFSAQM